MTVTPTRRIVTGHSAQGQAIRVVATALSVKMCGLANVLLAYAALAATGAIITWMSYRKAAA